MAKKPVSAPYTPAPWEDADVYAVRAVAAGNASEGQQKRFLDLVINRLCGTYDLSYRPDSDRDTTFAEGKRFVGLQLVKLMKIVPNS